MDQLTVNQLVDSLYVAVDPVDRDHVVVRMVIHGDDALSTVGKAVMTSGGTGYPFVNIVGDLDA